MIFTHLCRIVAVLGAVAGVLSLATGVRDSFIGPDMQSTANMQIKFGAEFVLGSIGLGTLAEISLSLRKIANG